MSKITDRGMNKYADIHYHLKEHTYLDRMRFDKIISKTKAYDSCMINSTVAGALLDMSYSEFMKVAREHKVFPKYYHRTSADYQVADVKKLAKKLGKTFVIPIGYFNTARYVYIGHEFLHMPELWHPDRVDQFGSVYAMTLVMGIPVQDIFIAPSILPKLEDDFIYATCKLIKDYNKCVEKKDRKHIVLCTKMNDRDEAMKIINKYDKRYPGILCTMDIDHLIYLRKLAHKNYLKSKC